MHTLADMAGKVNRSTVYLSGLQKRFELPAFEGATYPDAYLEFSAQSFFSAHSASAKKHCAISGAWRRSS